MKKTMLFVATTLVLVSLSAWAALRSERAWSREQRSPVPTQIYPPRSQGVLVLRLLGLRAEDLENASHRRLFDSLAQRGVKGVIKRPGLAANPRAEARALGRALDLGEAPGRRFQPGGDRVPWRGESISSHLERAGLRSFSKIDAEIDLSGEGAAEPIEDSPWSEDPDLCMGDRDRLGRAFRRLGDEPWRLATVHLVGGSASVPAPARSDEAEDSGPGARDRSLQSLLLAAGGLIDRVGSSVTVLLLVEGDPEFVPFALAGEGIRPSPTIEEALDVARIHDAVAALLGLRPSVLSAPSPLLQALDLTDLERRQFDESRRKARTAMKKDISAWEMPLSWPYEFYRWTSALAGALAALVFLRLCVSLRSARAPRDTSESSST